ncbi:MAG TPA: polysaccharide deacetylase family protein [Bacteroidales bacterium]|nr:polysaccharide deacetylase family protein [Bacteroidales bacterium]
MLKLKYILILILILLSVIGPLVAFSGFSPAWYILPGVILIFFTALGSFKINLSFYFDVVSRIKSTDKIVLTFDDGPDENITPKVLEVLKKNNVKAVFFFIGHKAEKLPTLVKQAFDEGHIVGNHSWCHKNTYGFFTARMITADLERSSEAIKKITGVKPIFFRPPFGVTNPNMKRALTKLKLMPVGWSLRSLDTVNHDTPKLKKRISKVKAGDIVLFHDRVQGIDLVADEFIQYCKQQQLTFARLDEALNVNAYE